MCGFQGMRKPYTISGDNGERDPPVPIPNTEVKPFSADGTWLETTWESRTLPDSTKKSLRRCLGLFLCASRQVLLPGRFQANVQHCTWLGSPMCAAGGGSSTWGNTWESRTLPDSAWGLCLGELEKRRGRNFVHPLRPLPELSLMNVRQMKADCFTKRNSMDIIAIGSFASEVEIVPLRASLEVTK